MGIQWGSTGHPIRTQEGSKRPPNKNPRRIWYCSVQLGFTFYEFGIDSVAGIVEDILDRSSIRSATQETAQGVRSDLPTSLSVERVTIQASILPLHSHHHLLSTCHSKPIRACQPAHRNPCNPSHPGIKASKPPHCRIGVYYLPVRAAGWRQRAAQDGKGRHRITLDPKLCTPGIIEIWRGVGKSMEFHENPSKSLEIYRTLTKIMKICGFPKIHAHLLESMKINRKPKIHELKTIQILRNLWKSTEICRNIRRLPKSRTI
jgi:hypothetical protein